MNNQIQILSRVELQQYPDFSFENILRLLVFVPDDSFSVDNDVLTIFAANILNWPITKINPVMQVDRFVLVEYEPVMGNDPDLLFCVGINNPIYTRNFNNVIYKFQDARRVPMQSPRTWMNNCKKVAKELVKPMWDMQVSRDEAGFIFRWVALAIAKGRNIRDGITGGYGGNSYNYNSELEISGYEYDPYAGYGNA